jgi:hypothetical protein
VRHSGLTGRCGLRRVRHAGLAVAGLAGRPRDRLAGRNRLSVRLPGDGLPRGGVLAGNGVLAGDRHRLPRSRLTVRLPGMRGTGLARVLRVPRLGISRRRVRRLTVLLRVAGRLGVPGLAGCSGAG